MYKIMIKNFFVNRKGNCNRDKIDDYGSFRSLRLNHNYKAKNEKSSVIVVKKGLVKSDDKNKNNRIDYVKIREALFLENQGERNVQDIHKNIDERSISKLFLYPFPDV